MGRGRGKPRQREADLGGRKAFAVVPPGLEQCLVAELNGLGVDATETEGGALFAASWKTLATVCHGSTVASGVRLRLARVKAGRLEELAHGVRSIPWSKFVVPRQPLEVRVSSRQSRLKRASAVAKKVELAVGDALRGPRLSAAPARRTTPATVHVRIVDDRAEISMDCAGDPLHRRGWRQQTAKAPIRENLAAAVLYAVEWSPEEALVDPMCGSGTLAIEACRRLQGLGPRLPRTYAFETFPCAPRLASPAPKRSGRRGRVYASDRDPGAIQATRGNGARAKVDGLLTSSVQSFFDLQAPAETGVLVSNLPYGKRIGGKADIERFYRQVGAVLRTEWRGWRVGFVLPADVDPSVIHGGLRKVLRFDNGGLKVAVIAGRIG